MSNVFGIEGADEGDAQVETEAPKEETQEQAAAPAEEPAAEEPPQEQAPEAPAHEPSEDDDEDELAADAEGVRIGNKVYKSIESADRAFKRTQGRLQRTDRLNNELMQEKARLLAVIEGLSRTPPPQPPPPEVKAPEPPAKPRKLAELVDDEEADRLVAEGGAGAMLRRFAELAEERLAQVVDEKTAFVQEYAQKEQWARSQEEFFGAAYELTDEQGNRLYPELDIEADRERALAVHAIWLRNLQKNPQIAPIAFSQFALDSAINEYRTQAARTQTQPTAAPSKPATPTLVLQARKADKSLVASSGSVRPTGVKSGNGQANEGWLAARADKHEVFGAIG